MGMLKKLRRHAPGGNLAVLIAAAVLGGGALVVHNTDSAPTYAQPTTSQLGELLSKVRVVAAIDNVPGYERSCKASQGCVFGRAWNDPTDHSGCDTRNRVLAAQLKDVQFKAGTHNCKVISGWVYDPYTGVKITAQQSQIDHVFPLHRAWNSGAAAWTIRQRQVFANDLTNLLAVSAKANESKGDLGIGDWLPSRTVEDCPYVLQYLTVAGEYHLLITEKDRGAAINACSH